MKPPSQAHHGALEIVFRDGKGTRNVIITIKITGSDKQAVGSIAAKIKSIRPPEPYKGKGVREKGQYVLKKEGKKK